MRFYWKEIKEPFAKNVFDDYLLKMPQPIQEKIKRYRRWEDQHMCLLSRLLLVKGMSHYDFVDHSVLERIEYSKTNRPFISRAPDFNISHSGNVAVCAFHENKRIGIDIEQHKKLNIQEFSEVFTSSEMKEIKEDSSYPKSFFDFWTKKEAIMKADGRGLGINPLEIKIGKGYGLLGDVKYLINELEIMEGYSCHYAIEE